MTPPSLDAEVVQVRLARIRQLLGDLRDIGEVTVDRLDGEAVVRYAVERVLTAVVDLAVSVNAHIAGAVNGEGPLQYAESFRAATSAGAIPADLAEELAPSAGMRNLLVHQYLDVDPARVAEAAALAPAAYDRYVQAVAAFLVQVSMP